MSKTSTFLLFDQAGVTPKVGVTKLSMVGVLGTQPVEVSSTMKRIFKVLNSFGPRQLAPIVPTDMVRHLHTFLKIPFP